MEPPTLADWVGDVEGFAAHQWQREPAVFTPEELAPPFDLAAPRHVRCRIRPVAVAVPVAFLWQPTVTGVRMEFPSGPAAGPATPATGPIGAR